MEYVPRAETSRLRRLLRVFPAVLVTGPRQCGKSTFVRETLPGWRVVDLERPADLALLRSDAEGFFDAHPRRVVIDEAQRFPELFALFRHVLDRSPQKGRFVLLGSASPSLVREISESLAGRIGLLELTPFRAVELARTPLVRDRWFWGGYPPLYALRSPGDRAAWLDAYVSLFLERDLSALGLRLPPERLRTLWTMLTHVHGSLLNVSDLARSLAVSSHTVDHYLDVLEGAFMIRRLHPWHGNVLKRLAKRPKVYVRDTGLLHFLAGLRRPEELETWPRRGHSFEGLVVEEIAALVASRVARPAIAYWRTQAGAEVDLLVGDGRPTVPIEVKLGASVDPRSVAGLRQCVSDLGLRKGWVVANVTERTRLGSDVVVVPWTAVARGEADFGLGSR